MNATFLQRLAFGMALTVAMAGIVDGAVPVSRPDQPSATGAGNSHLPLFSGDARSVAFLSQANNLVTNDDLGPSLDLFVRDLAASNTVLVSVSSNGIGGADRDVGAFALSTNAHVVAFETTAGNLVPGDANLVSDIFVRDIPAGVTRLVSVSADGASSGNGPSFSPLLSVDGRFVVFESLASNLVTNDFNGTNDVFLRDLVAGTTTLVSLNMDGTASAHGSSHSPAISADGLIVAFVSSATNIVAGVTNRAGEIYVRFTAIRETRWVSASHLSAARDPLTRFYSAFEPALSANGRWVIFKTKRGALVRFDTSRPTNFIVQWFPGSPEVTCSNLFLFQDNPRIIGPIRSPVDLTPGGFGDTALSFSPNGQFAAFTTGTNGPSLQQTVLLVDFENLVISLSRFSEGGGISCTPEALISNLVPTVVVVSTNFGVSHSIPPRSLAPAMSDDGRRILFLSDGANASGMSSGAVFRVYLRDMDTDVLNIVSTNQSGAAGNVVSDSLPALTADGRFMAWESADPNLLADDMNDASDVFVRDLTTGETTLVSARHPLRPANTGAGPGLAIVTPGALNANGSRVAFLSADALLVANDTNGLNDAFFRDLPGGNIKTLSAVPFPVMNSPVVPPLQYFPSNRVVNVQLDVSGQRALFSGNPMVWRDLATGTNFVVASSSSRLRTALSPDGRFAFFDSANTAAIFVAPPVSDNNNAEDVFMWNSALTVHDQGRRVSILSGLSRAVTGNGSSILPLASLDGCRVAFLSRATDLTPDSATSTSFQVFVRDQFCHPTNYLNGTNLLISYRTVASSAPNGRSVDRPWPTGATNAVFSADSRFLFFQDGVSNVIYRHDLLNEFVVRVTSITNGLFATNIARVTNVTVCTDCLNPSPNADGRFVAYEAPGTNGLTNIVLRDIVSGATELISANTAGTGGGNGSSFAPLLSCDGRFVVFSSKAGDLVANDFNRTTDVFVRDRWAGATHCLSLNRFGTATGNRLSSNPVMSPDGRSVAFQSFASDLVPGDYNDTRDVFVVTLGGPDTDRDGLDDGWEVAYFNDLSRDGGGDFDGDGAHDAAEFRAGTDPTNNGSVFRVLSFTTDTFSPGGLQRTTTLLWAATPGRHYRVQVKPNDLGTSWIDLPGDVFATSTSANKTHTTPVADAAQSFYRVVVVP